MKPATLFRGQVVDGKLKLERRDDFAALVQSLEGKQIELTLRKYSRPRSPNQNRYLHGVVIPLIAECCGYDPEEMKTALKLKFLRAGDDVNGLARVRSTADLSTAEMTEFIEQVRRLAAEMGCAIPAPNEIVA